MGIGRPDRGSRPCSKGACEGEVRTEEANEGEKGRVAAVQEEVWGVVSRAQEVASQLTSLSSAATPEQAKAIIENIFSSLHATMINAMKTCQNLLALATEASTQTPFSPYVRAGLEQLYQATNELAAAMKRVIDLMEKVTKEQSKEATKSNGSFLGSWS